MDDRAGIGPMLGASTTVADQYLSALRSRGVRKVFANAGTDFAPIIESLVRAGESGREVPSFVTVPHENVAMAMAQGYHKVSGEPVAVMVHVTVGTANALCGLMNASRDNIPLLLAAGRTPVTEYGDAGSRDVSIHWGQEAFDQGGVGREYVKWDYELRAGQPVDAIVGRALDIAMTDPTGPVYLTLPREVLGGAASAPVRSRIKRPLGSPPPVPSPDVIERAADIISASENPLIVSGNPGRSQSIFDALAALAEDAAIPVVQGANASLPSGHTMNLGTLAAPELAAADVIIVVDAAVPWIPSSGSPAPGAQLIHIACDPLHQKYPYRAFDMDLAIAGDSVAALTMLRDAVRPKLAKRQAAVDARRKRIRERRSDLEARRAKVLKDARRMVPIHPAWVAHCLNLVKNEDALILNELGVPLGFLDIPKAGCFIAGGNAGGLGRSLGESLGAKLAAPERQVITALGDGAYMFNVPTAAHFVAQAEKLPTLTLVMNNAMWLAVKEAAVGMYPEGRAARANTLPLVDLKPSPAFEKIVEAFGGRGEKVEDPEEVPAALERGLDSVESGTPTVVNIVTRATRHG